MKKKVLIVASVISFIEWFNQENIEFLKKDKGCDVHLACDFSYLSDTDEQRTMAYIQKLRQNGICLHQVDFDRSPFGKRNRKAYRQIRKILADMHFDLIHCHTPTASMLVRLAARKTRKNGTTVMYTCHGFHFHKASSKKNWLFYYPVEKFLSRYCDYLVTINQEDYHRAQTFSCPNVRYIPGVGVDIEEIKAMKVDRGAVKKSIGVPEDAMMLLSVGELIERKNHEVVIRALHRLGRRDLYYVICGKGPLLSHLQSLSQALGLGDYVIFLGFRKDIPTLCHAADISAFPSKIEGLGLAGIEVMAAGVPLVSSNVHGILDYVKDGVTGFACSPTDVSAFAEAIETLASDAALREQMREHCLRAVEPFEKKNALRVMWGIYNEAL